MKRSASLLLLFIVVFSAAAVSYSQGNRTSRIPVTTVNFAQFEQIEGFTEGHGAYLRWQMASETGNIGFLVYRVGNSGLELVSDSLIQGSVAAAGLRTFYGGKYDFFDENGGLGSTYVIVSQAADGRRIQTRPFTPRFTVNFEAETGYTVRFLLSRARNTNGQIDKPGLGLTPELQAIVNASRQIPDPIMQRTVVSQPGVKIEVKTEGMYRVSRAELQNAGFEVDSDSANWRLFVNGNEQAIIVGDNNQYIDFYGKGMDIAESDHQIYYLINDTVAGLRMITKLLGPIGGTVASNNFKNITEKKERVNYNQNIHNGEVENYFGNAVISDPPLLETIDLKSVDPNGLDAIVTIRLQGLLAAAHSVHVVLNGNDLGVVNGTGVTNYSGDFTVPASFLLEGTNTVALNTTTSSDVSYFDSVKIRYSRVYTADQNRLQYFTPGYRRMDVGGFTTANVRVFDATLDGNPQQIINLAIEQNGGTFTVKMPANRPAVYYAIEDSAMLHSPSVTADAPSTLGSPDNTANVIIISSSAADFIAGAETWAAYRRGRTGGDFIVKVVDVADIFDEFSYGVRSGTGINHFLEYAYTHWQNPKPAYVMIMGDASYDHRNYEGFGYWDLVPTRSVSLIYEETGSDEALADFNHDGLADICIGRIPARNATNITAVLNKTISFETPANQTLDRGALLAYDLSLGYDFGSMSQILRSQLPASMPVLYVPRGLPEPNPNNEPDPFAHQNLMNGLNMGKYIVNYAGHGSAGVWGSSSFFSTADVPALTNTNNPSIFTMLTCFNGLFFRPTTDSLGEALLKAPNGGAAATWASTTETTPDYQLTMGREFYRLIAVGGIPRIGDLIKNAKLTIAGSDVGYSWVLLGDPMLKMR